MANAIMSSADSPPEKRARLDATNFESRNPNFGSNSWKGAPSSPPVQQPQQQPLGRSGSFSNRDDSPNHLGRPGAVKPEPRNLMASPEKEFGNRESPSSIEARRSDSLHDDFDDHRRRHDEATFFAGIFRSSYLDLKKLNSYGFHFIYSCNVH